VMLPLAIPDFGEREHLMFLLVMPWILDAKPRWLTAGLAAFGIALKPFFILVWLAVLAVRLLKRDRKWDPEDWLIPAGQILYLLWILIVTPEYLTLAKATSGVYGAFNRPLIEILLSAQTLLYVGVLVLCAVTPSSPKTRDLRLRLLCASVGFLAIVLVQHKGYGYHFYPLRAAVPLLLACALIDLEETRSKSLWKAVLVLPISALVVLQIVAASALKLEMPKQSGPLLPIVREYAPPGTPVLVLSTSLWPGWPLINYTGTRYMWRMAPIWTLPGLYPERPIRYHRPSAMVPTEKFVVDSLVEDMEKTPPRLVIEERGPNKEGFRGGDFDYVEYFLRDPRFRTLWQHYELLTEVPGYRVYREKPQALLEAGE
jgi:hypothetical protein